MVEIRPDQVAEFERTADAEFHRRLTVFLRTELPEETAGMDDTTLLRRVEDSARRAATYDITTEAGVAQFACLTFAAGPAFHEDPDIDQYLREPGELTPEERVEALVEYLDASGGDPA